MSVYEGLAPVLIGIFAAGIGLSFLLADRDSRSTRAFALFLGLTALMFASAPLRAFGEVSAARLTERFTGVLEGAILAASCEWLYRVGRTIAPAERASRRSAVLLRAAQSFAVVHAVLGFAFPDVRVRYAHGGWDAATIADPVFLVVFTPSFAAFALWIAGAVVIARAEIDAAERVRLRGTAIALPFLFSGLPLQPPEEYVTTALGEVILLMGAVRYYVMRGQRDQFLGRFLSPAVARLVRDRGLGAALEQRRGEITVVAFDLRGFTAFVEAAPPDEVMDLVQRYYAVIGEVSTRSGGTIKDFAGDGVLCLVGAPLPDPHHARRAVTLARTGIESAQALFARHRTLGIAAGVATGVVTTGAVGGEARLEYAAVGSAVNLASRLCARAEASEILCDASTVARAGADHFEAIGELELKGIGRAVAVYRARVAQASRS